MLFRQSKTNDSFVFITQQRNLSFVNFLTVLSTGDNFTIFHPGPQFETEKLIPDCAASLRIGIDFILTLSWEMTVFLTFRGKVYQLQEKIITLLVRGRVLGVGKTCPSQRFDKGDKTSFVHSQYFVIKNIIVVQISWLQYCITVENSQHKAGE